MIYAEPDALSVWEKALMPDDLHNVRELLRQFTQMMENMWIERETMRQTLMAVYEALPETIEESLKIAHKSPVLRDVAQKAFAEMHKALERESLEIAAEEILKNLPNTGRPN